jgi:hemerythrin-like metal-binding protein
MPQAILSPEISATGVTAMDELHQDLLNALVCLSSTPDTEYCERYAGLMRKMEHAFSTEEQWMEDINYPNLKNHREQHARVLSALHHVYSHVLDDNTVLGREVTERLLPQWLGFHISTMDAALAATLQSLDGETGHTPSERPVSIAG